jgi:glycosyltransferase involved in cell wall biosynthesis
MNVVVNGLPYFSRKLVEDLQEFAPQHRFRFFDTYNSKIEQVKFAWALRKADVLISINGVSDRSGSMDLALKMKKKIWFNWVGTDVILAVERFKNGSIYREYIDQAVHSTDAPWLQAELNSAQIEAKIVHSKWLDIQSNLNDFPSLQVYSYIAAKREDFYGWKTIQQLAIANPTIPFIIAGSDGTQLHSIPPNVQFKGWLNNQEMMELRNASPIFIRLAEHDGFSLSVLEALAAGCEVIWKYPFENCHQLIDIENDFSQVVALVKERNFIRNKENIAYIAKNFQKEVILNNFIQELEKIVG